LAWSDFDKHTHTSGEKVTLTIPTVDVNATEHTCPGCGSPCDPSVNVWGANLYGCAKCCPSVGSYSSRIVIKYPEDARRADVHCPPLIDGLTEAECLAEYALAQKDVKRTRELTPRQLEVAQAAWSAQLRAKVEMTARKDREQVLVDNSWWDD
jgi:hypothetical protein